jgi:hypothetical protein
MQIFWGGDIRFRLFRSSLDSVGGMATKNESAKTALARAHSGKCTTNIIRDAEEDTIVASVAQRFTTFLLFAAEDFGGRRRLFVMLSLQLLRY